MKLTHSLLTATALASALLGAQSFASAPPDGGGPGNTITVPGYVYYSNAAKTNQVGRQVQWCGRGSVSSSPMEWGVKSAYYSQITVSGYCPGGYIGPLQ